MLALLLCSTIWFYVAILLMIMQLNGLMSDSDTHSASNHWGCCRGFGIKVEFSNSLLLLEWTNNPVDSLDGRLGLVTMLDLHMINNINKTIISVSCGSPPYIRTLGWFLAVVCCGGHVTSGRYSPGVVMSVRRWRKYWYFHYVCL